MRRSTVFGLAAVLCVRSLLQQTPPANPQHPSYPDRTTPILEKMTADQRVHSRLFGYHTGRRLIDEGIIQGDSAPLMVLNPDVKPPAETDVLRGIFCAAKLAVAADALSTEAFPTDDGTFTFSELQARVTEVFRSAPPTNVVAGQVITLVRPGGMVTINGKPVGGQTYWKYPLLTVGTTYLLFLDRVPETGAFRPSVEADVRSAFVVGPRGITEPNGFPYGLDVYGRAASSARVFGFLHSANCR
jgi:hypothetical protein